MSILTVSHEIGAGGPEIGQKVAEQLGWHYVDQELISDAALRYGVLEEKLSLHHIDLYYRPVYAFRYRWQGKEAVVEFDGVTGETRTGGSTVEQFLGHKIDAEFLINAGVEAAGIFIPGARLAEIVISKSMKAREKKK